MIPNDIASTIITCWDCTAKTGSNGRQISLITALRDLPYYMAVNSLDNPYSRAKALTYGSQEYKDFKQNNVPTFTVSCCCAVGGSTKDVISFNRLICIDIDKCDNPDIDMLELKHKVFNLPEVYCVAYSISGQGLFVIMPLSGTDRFADRAKAAIKYFASFGIVADAHCTNINRLRISNYDPDILIKPDNAIIVDFTGIDNSAEERMAALRAEQARMASRKRSGSMFDDDRFAKAVILIANKLGLIDLELYADWIKFGWGCSTIGADGFDLYDTVSSTQPKYPGSAEVAKKYENLAKNCRTSRDAFLAHWASEIKKSFGPGWVKYVDEFAKTL